MILLHLLTFGSESVDITNDHLRQNMTEPDIFLENPTRSIRIRKFVGKQMT